MKVKIVPLLSIVEIASLVALVWRAGQNGRILDAIVYLVYEPV